MRFRSVSALFCLILLFAAFSAAQQAPVAPEPASDVEHLAEEPIFRVTTVAKTAHAINYQHRGGATKIDFVGTSLQPGSTGEAKVESKKGYIEIEVEFKGLELATKYGAEYLTYVMWAITPEGRTVNLGEILLDRQGRGKINVTTDLQVFALIVTAEPYFAVTMPSDVVVMENEIRSDTRGRAHIVDAKYELLQRGRYEKLSNPLALGLDLKNNPLEIYQARNAIEIAKSLGAATYAADSLQKAEVSLQQAEAAQLRRGQEKEVTRMARQTVQFAEDARALAVIREEEERLARERQEAAEREAAAREKAAEEARLREEAEIREKLETELRAKAEQAKDAAERMRLEAELAAARAQADMQQALREKEQAQRLISEARKEAYEAQVERERLAQAKAEAEAAAAEARREREQLAMAKADAEALAEQAIRERDELRQRMQDAFSKVVETKETARGLILNLPDILFDFGKSTLRGEAREVLSRVSGILLVTPGYKLTIEGHTDSVGSDEFNQKLSEARAKAVQDYMASAKLDPAIMSTQGFGKTQPVASNDTDAGRQKNRRVEIVVQDATQEGAAEAAATL